MSSGYGMDKVWFHFSDKERSQPIKLPPHSSWENIVSNKQHICPICLQILNNPEICSGCRTMFCGDCIKPYKAAYTCPCRCNSPSFQPVVEITLCCEECETMMNITDFNSHTECYTCPTCKVPLSSKEEQFVFFKVF